MGVQQHCLGQRARRVLSPPWTSPSPHLPGWDDLSSGPYWNGERLQAGQDAILVKQGWRPVLEGGLGYLRRAQVQRVGHTHEVGERGGLTLLHEAGTMHF